MSIYIKNDSGGDKTYLGQLIADQAYYYVQPQEEIAWANHSILLSDIGAGAAIVAKSDTGSEDLNDVAEAITYLRKEIKQVEFANKDSSGTSIIAMAKPTGDFTTYITHNFCDNTTWTATNNSCWELIPDAGEKWNIVKSEVQFEHDLDIGDGSNEMYLEYYVWHPSYPGTPVVGLTITVDSVRTLLELGNEHYHSPALPGIPTGLSTIVFSYVRDLSLYGDETFGELAKIKLTTKADVALTGSYATVGFVAVKESL